MVTMVTKSWMRLWTLLGQLKRSFSQFPEYQDTWWCHFHYVMHISCTYLGIWSFKLLARRVTISHVTSQVGRNTRWLCCSTKVIPLASCSHMHFKGLPVFFFNFFNLIRKGRKKGGREEGGREEGRREGGRKEYWNMIIQALSLESYHTPCD